MSTQASPFEKDENAPVTSVTFHKKTTPSVQNPKYLNSYGLDYSDEKAIKYTQFGYLFTVLGFIPTTEYKMLVACIKVEYSVGNTGSKIDFDKKDSSKVYIDTLDMFINTRLDDYVSKAALYLKPPQTDNLKMAIASLRDRLNAYRNDKVANRVKETPEDDYDGRLRIDAEYFLTQEKEMMDTLDALLSQAGVATEFATARFLFFIMLSRFFEKPLHAILQGSSPICTQLLDVVTQSVPSDQITECTSISTGSLYYTKAKDFWKNKVLYLRSMNKQFRGAGTVQEFINNGFLSRHTAESDYKTHQLRSSQKVVAGNICFVSQCNDDDFNARYFSECLSIRLSENSQNSEALLKRQRMEAARKLNPDDKTVAIGTLRAIQSVLSPMEVIIPYAMDLYLPKTYPYALRDQPKFFTLIKTVALFYQKTKPTRDGVMRAEYSHLDIAAELFQQVLVNRADTVTQKERHFIEKLKDILSKKHKLKENESTDESFKVPDLLPEFNKMSQATLYRRMESLRAAGVVERVGGDNKNANEYKLVMWDDYKAITKSAEDWVKEMKQLKEGKELKKK
jgi:DNA primase